MTCFVITGGYNVWTKSTAWIYLAQSPHDDRGTIMTLILQVQKRYTEVNLFKVTPSESGDADSKPKNLTPGLTLNHCFLTWQKRKHNSSISAPMNKCFVAFWDYYTQGTSSIFVPRMHMQIRREVQDQLIREVPIKHYCELGTGQLWTDVLTICFLFKLMVWKWLDAAWGKGVARWPLGQPCHAVLLGPLWGRGNDSVQGG